MEVRDLLHDGFVRLPPSVAASVEGLDAAALRWRPAPDANPIGWLAWHLARVQDDHVAEVAGTTQIWTSGGWAPRFGLPDGVRDTGFGHDATQVASVVPEGPGAVVDHLEAVTERTLSFVSTLSADDLDRVVDSGWDPPVTLGVRLMSVLTECHQHAGQVAYVRGLFDRAL